MEELKKIDVRALITHYDQIVSIDSAKLSVKIVKG